jgi:rubredoxin
MSAVGPPGSPVLPGPPARKGNTRLIGIVGKISVTRETKTETVEVAQGDSGLFGLQVRAFWDKMGVLPIGITMFGVAALALKLAKVKNGAWRAGDDGVNRATTHTSIPSTAEELQELHVFKCSGCGYEMYPARGREFKFFPDSFKCPLCQTPKDGFWDLNDPTDPRNQEDDENDEDSEEEAQAESEVEEETIAGGAQAIDGADDGDDSVDNDCGNVDATTIRAGGDDTSSSPPETTA